MYTEKINEEIKTHTIFTPSKGKDWIRHIADRYFRELFFRTTGEIFDVLSIVPVQVLSGDKKQEVCEFHEIFQRCLKPSKEGVHLLLEGRAGIGKSTMMRLLAHFSGAVVLDEKVEHPLYREAKALLSRFPLTLSIPLKELEGDYPIHWKEYIFQEMGIREEEKSEFDATLESLCSKREVLFLLDGLDGVKESLDFQATGIDQILRLQDWVMTSRPDCYQQKRAGEVQRFELVGLSIEGVPQFIHAYFSDGEEAEALIQFISQSPHLSMIATIPFLLEILCYSWREDRKRVFSNANITSLYGMLVLNTVRKYLEPHSVAKIAYLTSLEKLITDRKTTHKTPRTCVSIFIQILEQFAFRQLGLEDKKYVFRRTDLDLLDLVSREIRAFGHEEVISEEDTGLVMDLIFDQLGLFRSLNPHRGEFLHSSIQEYFAGRHLATCVEKDLPIQGVSWKEWVDNNRFNTEFATVFRFAVGILDAKKQSEKLNEFFTLFLDQTNASYFRFHEICLAASFLEEVRNVEIPQREYVVQRIANWIRFEEYFPLRISDENRRSFDLLPCNLNGLNGDLLRSLSLLNHPTIVRAILTESQKSLGGVRELCTFLQISSQEILDQLVDTLEDPNANERAIAAEILGYLGIHYIKVVETLLRFSEDSDPEVRISCIRAIGGRRGSEDLLSATLFLKEKMGLVSLRRGEARSRTDLGAKLIHRAMNMLIKHLLDDPEERVRVAAAETLGDLQIQDSRVVEALIRGASESSSNIQISCVQALGRLKIHERWVQDQLLALLNVGSISSDVANALGNIGWDDDLTISALEQMTQSLSAFTRTPAFLALNEILPPSWRNTDQLMAFSQSEQYFLRLRALFAMVSHVHTSEAVVRTLIRMLSDENEYLRFLALVALDQLEEKSEELLESMMHCLLDSSSRVRNRFVEILRKEEYLSEKVIQRILESQNRFPSDPDSEAIVLGGGITPAWEMKSIESALKSYYDSVIEDNAKSSRTREFLSKIFDDTYTDSVIRAIGSSGTRSPKAVEFLKGSLNSGNVRGLFYSIQSLFQLCPGSAEATEALENYLQNTNSFQSSFNEVERLMKEELQDLLQITKGIIPQICLLLDHEDENIQANAMRFLGQYQFEEHVQWFDSQLINIQQFMPLVAINIRMRKPLIFCSKTHFVYLDQQKLAQLSLSQYPFLPMVFNYRGVRYHTQGLRYKHLGDHENAFQAFQMAAEMNSSDAHHELAIMLYHGLGITKDVERAIVHLTKAAEGGDLEAHYNLGFVLGEGEGITNDVKRSIFHLTKAAEGGYLKAMNSLALMFDFGRGVERNVREAVKFYKMASDLGDNTARGNLAELYQFEDEVRDLDEAFRLFSLAADEGSVDAIFGLGVCYEFGEGTPKNQEMANSFYNQAIEFELLKLWKENRLVYQDARKIEVLKRLASEQSETLVDLGAGEENFRKGLEAEFGDHPDREKARMFYLLAAEDGNEDAIERLNEMDE